MHNFIFEMSVSLHPPAFTRSFPDLLSNNSLPHKSQCSAGQLEGSGQEDEFLCTTCSRVLRNVDMFSAAALEAVCGVSGGGGGRPGPSGPQSGSSEQGSSTRWVSSTKVGGWVLPTGLFYLMKAIDDCFESVMAIKQPSSLAIRISLHVFHTLSRAHFTSFPHSSFTSFTWPCRLTD